MEDTTPSVTPDSCRDSLATSEIIPLLQGKGLFAGRVYSDTEDQTPVVGIQGCQCSGVTKIAAKLATPFKVPIVSGSATNAALSDKAMYPYFFRTVPPDSLQSKGTVRLLQYFNWKRMSLLIPKTSYAIGKHF